MVWVEWHSERSLFTSTKFKLLITLILHLIFHQIMFPIANDSPAYPLQSELGLLFWNTHNKDIKTFLRYKEVGIKERKKINEIECLSVRKMTPVCFIVADSLGWFTQHHFQILSPWPFSTAKAGGLQHFNPARGSQVDTVLANAWDSLCKKGFTFPNRKTKSLWGRRSFC